jgi:hypothetical protein
LITIGLSAQVAAPPRRVWDALADPARLGDWHPGLAPLDAERPWPAQGARLRWRTRLRGIPLEVRETSAGAVAGERLALRIELGLFRCDATFSLAPLGGEPPRTQVGLQLQMAGELRVVGGTLDRFDVRRVATELAAARLGALREACEGGAAAPGR